MRQGVIICPVKGEQALAKCDWWRRRGLKACLTCKVRPLYLSKHNHGERLRPAETCPRCGRYKHADSKFCGECSKSMFHLGGGERVFDTEIESEASDE